MGKEVYYVKSLEGDLDILNNFILEMAHEDKKDSTLALIQSKKERGYVFWKTKMPQAVRIV